MIRIIFLLFWVHDCLVIVALDALPLWDPLGYHAGSIYGLARGLGLPHDISVTRNLPLALGP